MVDTQNPGPLPDANSAWVKPDWRPTVEFFQYFRAVDKVIRTVVGVINQPDTPLPTDLRNEYLEVACSDEALALAAGTGKVTFRLPYLIDLIEVRASLKTAQSSGSIFMVDINANGSSILSTKITIDNGERTSKTAATPPVLSTTNLADDSEMTVDIDQIGDGTARGLKVLLIGTRPAP